MHSVLEEVRPIVDATITKLSSAKFVIDPIAGEYFSRVTSVVSSAYKRHGGIIEIALFHAISSHNALQAWSRVPFYVNGQASTYVENSSVKTEAGRRACLETSMPYRQEGSRYEIDILYFDHRTDAIVALEVKRGNGQFDRGKRDSMIKSALTIRTLLRSYAEAQGWRARSVESRILAYYGVPRFPPEIYLRGDDLDHFIAPGVQASIEEVNDYFRAQLYRVVEGDVGQGSLIQ